MADEKTIADVADKLVDKISGGVEHLADAVNKIAPNAWAVMVRGQRTQGICESVFCIAVIVVLALATRMLWRKIGECVDNGGDLIFFRMMALVIALIVGAIALWNMQLGAQRAACPEYYAAKELLAAVK